MLINNFNNICLKIYNWKIKFNKIMFKEYWIILDRAFINKDKIVSMIN